MSAARTPTPPLGTLINIEGVLYSPAVILRKINSHDALITALDSIERYGLDTMTGPMETPPDLAAWYREGVREMVHRARAALKAAKGEA